MPFMVATTFSTGPAPRPVTEAVKQRLAAQEADGNNPGDAKRRHLLTLEGLADVDAGHLIDDEAMQAWADSLGTDHELPVPPSG